MIIYVSGKYTGDTEENIFKAQNVASKLFEAGHTPVIPHSMYGGMERYGISYDTFMEADIRLMVRCDAILMMDEWQQSDGAKRERQIAMLVGMDILFECTFFKEECE